MALRSPLKPPHHRLSDRQNRALADIRDYSIKGIACEIMSSFQSTVSLAWLCHRFHVTHSKPRIEGPRGSLRILLPHNPSQIIDRTTRIPQVVQPLVINHGISSSSPFCLNLTRTAKRLQVLTEKLAALYIDFCYTPVLYLDIRIALKHASLHGRVAHVSATDLTTDRRRPPGKRFPPDEASSRACRGVAELESRLQALEEAYEDLEEALARSQRRVAQLEEGQRKKRAIAEQTHPHQAQLPIQADQTQALSPEVEEEEFLVPFGRMGTWRRARRGES